MPSVQLSLLDLESLLGGKLPRDRDGLNQVFAYVKGDVESLDEQTGTVNVEIKDSNHPDIWSVEGIARALRGFLGIGQQRKLRIAGTSRLDVIVDKRLKAIRPYIACAIVKNLYPSEHALESWIGLQDKMDQTYGRKRKKASIGFYQADLVEPPLRYTVSKPDASSFIPLGSSQKMSLSEILKEHEKGREYGPIISTFDEWPLLVDGRGQILSLPPVINSNDLGRVTTETRNVLVEVTGTNLETVQNTLKIVVTSLSERGGKVYTCFQKYQYGPSRRTVTPDIKPVEKAVSLSYVNKTLGTSLSSKATSVYLRRAGYSINRISGDTIRVQVPFYRLDIMHQIDIVEDIAIAMDLNSLKPDWPQVWTPGGLDPATDKFEALAEVMVGLGYQEVLTYTLTDRARLEEKMRTKPGPLVELKNPKMTTYTALRNWLLPSILEFLSNNTHVDYPQRVFEVGSCELLEKVTSSPATTFTKLSAATVHATAGFTEIRAALDALLGSAGIDFSVEPAKHPSFLDGRFGLVVSKGENLGFLGEVHPEVIRSWGLNLPTAAFELDLSLAGSG